MRATPRALVGDVCSIITKGTTPTTLGMKFQSDGLPFLRAQNVAGGKIILDNELLFIDGQTHDALRRSVILHGDVLLTIAGTIGRAAEVPEDAPAEMNCNQAVAILRPKNNVDRAYMRHWLESDDAQEQIFGATVTGTISNLSLGQIRGLQIPLPPLEEQKRIAAILDKADALRARRRQAIALLDSLTQSIFLEMFGDPVSNPKGWDESFVLSDLADIGSGITKGRPTRGQATRAVPYLAVANVQDRALNLAVVKEIQATEDEIARYRLRKDDLLVTEGGDPDKLGRGTLWSDELPEAIHQNHIFRIRFRDRRILPIFANWLIGSERGKTYFLRSVKQTTGIASINKTQLSNFPVMLPPIDRQVDFAERSSHLASMQIKLRTESHLFTSLFASLQHRAFAGQL